MAKFFGVADKVPFFYAPSEEVFLMRTFLHPDWMPIALVTIVYFLTVIPSDIALSLLTRQLYIEIEKLPFPMSLSTALSINTLIKRDKERFNILVLCSLIGFIYGMILYGLPVIGDLFGIPLRFLPIPWYDFNIFLHKVIPGASLGIITDLAAFSTGFIVPFPSIIGMFSSSFAFYFIGNALLVNMGLTAFSREWAFGMSVTDSYQRSFLYAWICPGLGVALAAGLTPILLKPKVLVQTFSSLRKLKTGGGNLYWILGVFLSCTSALTIFDLILAPDVPVWMLIFLNMLWPFIYILIIARGEAEAVPFSIPYMRELVFTLGGLKAGSPGWFVPINLTSSWTMRFKICEITRTDHMSFIKGMLIAFPISLLFGWIYMQRFWQIAPIPSPRYPATEIYWPLMATFQSIFVSRSQEFFVPQWILGAFAITAILYIILSRFNLGLIVIGMAAGVFSAIPGTFSMLISGIIGQILQRIIGRENWRRKAPLIVAGLGLGEGLAVGLAGAIAIITSSMWILPY